MGDTEAEQKQDAVAPSPAPPTPEAAAEPSTRPKTQESQEEKLQQARKFLQDAQVQDTTPERRVEFLKSKGLSESDIAELLKEISQDEAPNTQATIKEERIEPPVPKKEDRPPIVTYPEFLTKPTRPPPLVTVNGFLNTLYAFAGLSTLVYGASKYVVEPMVENLTEARISLHDTANQDLAKLVSKLEATVSELPPPKSKSSGTSDKGDDDTASSYDDPTELFHRDIGVQTSLPTSPTLPSATAAATTATTTQQETPTTHQTKRLASLLYHAKLLNEGLERQTNGLSGVQTAVEELNEDMEKLNAAAATDFTGGFSLYGAASRSEPDDEIKKAKENIRRVKGVLLSTRSFPSSR